MNLQDTIALKKSYQKSEVITCYNSDGFQYSVILEVTSYWNPSLPIIYLTIVSDLTGEYNVQKVYHFPQFKHEYEIQEEGMRLFTEELENIVNPTKYDNRSRAA